MIYTFAFWLLVMGIVFFSITFTVGLINFIKCEDNESGDVAFSSLLFLIVLAIVLFFFDFKDDVKTSYRDSVSELQTRREMLVSNKVDSVQIERLLTPYKLDSAKWATRLIKTYGYEFLLEEK